jgi:hypothetical protein
MAVRKFTLEDQLWFAKASGDVNPIHIDPIYARRSQFGEVIVHGIHLVLWSLNELAAITNTPLNITALEVSFLKPVKLSQDVVCVVETKNICEYRIRLMVGDLIVTSLQVKASSCKSPFYFSFRESEKIDELPSEFNYDDEEHFINPSLFDKSIAIKYPRLPYVLSEAAMLNLLAMTFIVGMKCPGLHSIFSSFNVVFADQIEKSNLLAYRVSKYHERFSRLTIALHSSSMMGQIVAFIRPTLKRDFTMEAAQVMVKNMNFSGQRALIIGGSRGLGEITTKLLAAAGANILFTYYKGEKEAAAVCDQINKPGVRFIMYDASGMPSQLFTQAVTDFAPTHVYYYATPFIFSTDKGKFNFESFVQFSSYYLKGFYNVFSLCSNTLQGVFYPSSTAIDEKVDTMIEYSCSKVAGEMLCDFLSKMNPAINIYQPRLPRLNTDQTQTLIQVEEINTEKFILDQIHTFIQMERR